MSDLSFAMLAFMVYALFVVCLFLFWAWVSSGAWWGLVLCMVSFVTIAYAAFCIADHKP